MITIENISEKFYNLDQSKEIFKPFSKKEFNKTKKQVFKDFFPKNINRNLYLIDHAEVIILESLENKLISKLRERLVIKQKMEAKIFLTKTLPHFNFIRLPKTYNPDNSDILKKVYYEMHCDYIGI